jgi:hypothetical protein
MLNVPGDGTGFLETAAVPGYESLILAYIKPYTVIIHIKTKIYFVVQEGKPLKFVVKFK